MSVVPPPRAPREVLLVAPRHPEMSGGSTFVSNLEAALQARGHRVQVASIWPGSPASGADLVVFPREHLHRGPVFRGHDRRSVINLLRVVGKRIDRHLALRRFRRSVERLGPDCLVVFTHVAAKIVLDEAGYRRTADGPVLVGQHHSQYAGLEHETWLRDALRQHFADVDAFTALSADDATDFGALVPVPTYAIANPAAMTLRAPVTPSESRTVVALARYSQEKNLAAMIRIFARATEQLEDRRWRLELYGEGDCRPALQAEIEATGAGDRIRLCGRTEKPADVLRSAALNLLTSTYEGFGMSVLEAATMGVPSMAFDCSPGLRDLLAGGAGVLISPGDENAYAARLRRLLANPADLDALGEAAHRRAEQFSPAPIAEQWEQLFEACSVHRLNESAAP